jgi:hypothetical protein
MTRPWLKVGDKVRYKMVPLTKRITREGVGHITKVFLPLGNCPITYHVDTFTWGCLFAHEVEKLP